MRSTKNSTWVQCFKPSVFVSPRLNWELWSMSCIILLYMPPHSSHLLQPLGISCVRQASEAYQTSLWYSIADKTSTRDQSIDNGASPTLTDERSEVLPKKIYSTAPHRFNQSTRDSLFATLVIYAHDHSPESLQDLCAAFPSIDLLNALVHSFFAGQDKKVDSWIHSASFKPNARNTELTAIILATSVLGTSCQSLRRLGIGIRRLLRPVILEKVRLFLRRDPSIHGDSSQLIPDPKRT